MKDHEYSLSVLYVCLKNLCIIALFIYLAMYFHYWWLSLFAIIFQSGLPARKDVNTEDELSNIVRCYACGEILFVNDITDAVHNEMEDRHWVRIETDGKWINLCPHCTNKYYKSKTTPAEQ